MYECPICKKPGIPLRRRLFISVVVVFFKENPPLVKPAVIVFLVLLIILDSVSQHVVGINLGIKSLSTYGVQKIMEFMVR